jgi:ABC-type multidrug transport system fused ATPase/permease subunit
MVATFSKLLDLLSPRERRRLWVVLGFIVLAGLVEMVGVASILPFLAVLADPAAVETNRYLAWAYAGLGFESPRTFLAFLGAAVLAFVVFSLGVRLAATFMIARFANMRAYSLSSQLIENYMRQPYTWFLDRNSAGLGKVVLIEVDRAIGGGLVPAIRLVAQSVVVLSLFALLLAVEPYAALFAAGLFGGSYVLIFLTVRKTLSRLGRTILEANYRRYKIAQESLAGIKDVKILGVEESFMRQFREPARLIARARALSAVISEMPRYLLEAIAVGGTMALVLFLMSRGEGSLTAIVPTLGVFAFAGIRMFPALQALYQQVTGLRIVAPAVDELHRDMTETRARLSQPERGGRGTPLRLRQRLEIVDVDYAYPNAERAALRALSLTVAANTTVGIVGGSGAGKTTTVDLVLGLLEPQAGELRVDGVPITRQNLRAWQQSIGYVPQQIFLTDDSVEANIAFGVPPEAIERAAVERAARVAELHEFVTRELPKGYATLVGERGVRLSGGQRQRIGIARALYHDPDVLILDEATSALDNLTERAVMDAVRNLGHAKTILMIAHRLSTVKDCDTIFMMEGGRVVAEGSYAALLGSNQKFRAMAAGAV